MSEHPPTNGSLGPRRVTAPAEGRTPHAGTEQPGGGSGVPGYTGLFPLVLLLFFGSGCAALIYEVIWFQLLQLVIGASAVSLGVLLGVFMGGMCAGSLLLPKLVPMDRNPFFVYAFLELGVGCFGVAVVCLLPELAKGYAALSGSGLAGFVWRGLLCAVCLLPPTMLMGATLPAIARAVETTPEGVSWLGWFYGGNIAGAVFGSLLAGFYLLRLHNMLTATLAAAALNVAVSAAAFWIGSRGQIVAAKNAEATVKSSPRAFPVYVAIGISGACALAAEVVWTRLLSLMLGPTVYTFSIILAVFLGGLGLGSGAGSLLARSNRRPRAAFGACQLLLVAAIAWTAYMLARSLPYWPINPSLAGNPWVGFQLDLVRCAWAILPPALLWGASFPLAVASAAGDCRDDAGRLVGRVYAANTLGAIVGALLTSLVLLSWLGSRHVQQVLVLCSGAGALLMFLPASGPAPTSKEISCASSTKAPAVLAAVIAVGFFVWIIPGIPWGLVAYGRSLPTRPQNGVALYVGEGVNASVVVSELANGVRNFHVSGKIEASSEFHDMRLQRMLGHIPALLHSRSRSVLVVGCGAGVTAGSFVLHPDVERIVICEIEPLIPRVVAQYFGDENYDVLADPRVTVVYDDARHFILTAREKFDIITSDPIHPWVKGAATLYTREYFELCRRHLNPGGLVTQWVPLYESSPAAVKSEFATFFDAFPNGTVWSNDEWGAGYDVVLLGGDGGSSIDLGQVQQRLSSKAYGEVAQSLNEIGCRSGYSLLANYAGRATDLRPWLADAQLNRDRDLRLQYLAGMGLNRYDQDAIYSDMLFYRKFPEDLFAGSAAQREALRMLIERTGKNKAAQ